jgi:hypothetical protein
MIATLASWRPRETQQKKAEFANSNPAQSILGKGTTTSSQSLKNHAYELRRHTRRNIFKVRFSDIILQESITANFSFLAQKKLDNLPTTLAAFAFVEDGVAMGADLLAYPKTQMQALKVFGYFPFLIILTNT